MLLDSSIRVVLADLSLPKVNAFDLVGRARSSKVQRIRELPLVVVAGADEHAECEHATAAGATDFIDTDIKAA
jgi:CheY-like chemotaxis protein